MSNDAKKEQILRNLKSQWKSAVISQFKKEPEKVRKVSCNKCAIYSSCKAVKFHTKAGNCPLVKLINASGVNV